MSHISTKDNILEQYSYFESLLNNNLNMSYELILSNIDLILYKNNLNLKLNKKLK